MRNLFLIPTLVVFCLLPGISMAQNIVALYTPSLNFQDGGARNQFVNQIAKVLSDKTGQSWEGKAFARSSDFESSRSTIDVAVLDADYFSSKSQGLQAVAMLSADGSNKRPLKLIARKGKSDKLYDYRDHKIALSFGSAYANSFLTASALGHEINANEYFSSLDEAKDIHTAINAVEMGNADLTIAFDGYDSGFTTIYTSPAVGLPVIAINTSKVSDTTLNTIKPVLQNLAVKTSFITGSTTYDASAANTYQNIAKSKKPASLSYQPAEPENIKFKTSNLSLPSGQSGLPLNPRLIRFTPSVSSLDGQLERRL